MNFFCTNRKNSARGALRRSRHIAVLLAVAGALVACTPHNQSKTGEAAEGEEERFVVTKKAYLHLREIRKALADDNYEEALEELDRMNERKFLNPHERALMYQLYAQVYASQGKLEPAAQNLEQALAEDALPEAATLDVKYNLGQLFLVTEKYKRAGALLSEWLERAENPGPEAYYVTATAHAQAADYDKALPYAKEAVARVDEPPRGWLELLLSLYFELGQHEQVIAVLKRMVKRFPEEKKYWLQLSAAYSEAKDTARSLAVLEIAYRQGMVTEEQQLINLSKLYLAEGLPLKAGRILEKGMADDVIEKTPEVLELYATTWLQAREYDKAASALDEAAEMAQTGDLYLQLAQVHARREEWKKARLAIRKALGKGNLENAGEAHLLLGTTSYNAGLKGAARAAFGRARTFDRSKSAAEKWIAVLDAEEKRCEQGVGAGCERKARPEESLEPIEVASRDEPDIDPEQQKFVGRYRFVGAPAQGRAVIRRAVEEAIGEMSPAARAIAMRRFERNNSLVQSIGIEVRGGKIRVSLDRFRFVSRPGAKKSITTPNGDAALMIQRFSGGKLVQTFSSERGTLKNVFSLSGEGKTLNRAVTITSPELKKAIRFRLSYKRKR